MRNNRDYRIARLHFLHDLMTQISEEEPELINSTDWHTNRDAINQMIELLVTYVLDEVKCPSLFCTRAFQFCTASWQRGFYVD